MGEDLVHKEEPVHTLLPSRDPVLGREDPEPGKGGVPKGGAATNCQPPIVCATTASRCPLTSNSRFGGNTGEDHPSRKADNTTTAVKGAIGVTVRLLRAAGARAPSVKEASSDIVQLTGQWQSMLSYLHPLSEPVEEPCQSPTDLDTTRADANIGPSLANTEHVCPADAHRSHDNVRKHPSSPATGVEEPGGDPPNCPKFHIQKPQFEYAAGHPVHMAKMLSRDFQLAVPKDATCGKDHPPICGPQDDGNGAATKPSRMRALKTDRHPDHGDPEELVGNKRT